MDELLAQRDKLNAAIQQVLDQNTAAWGVKVTNVEIKDIDLDETMIRAMAQQAEAERARRAKVIHADGEKQAAQTLTEAARLLSERARLASAALSADAGRHLEREKLADRVPAAAGSDRDRCCPRDAIRPSASRRYGRALFNSSASRTPARLSCIAAAAVAADWYESERR